MIRLETERKFLVRSDAFEAEAVAKHRLCQGYIACEGGNSVRVRIDDGKGILTVKGPGNAAGISRSEWETEIPLGDAEALLGLCRSRRIEKTRYIIPAGNGRKWEVDRFYGENEGLVLAEIELGSADETFESPAWLGEEVTGDVRFYNSYLSRRPFKTWSIPVDGVEGQMAGADAR